MNIFQNIRIKCFKLEMHSRTHGLDFILALHPTKLIAYSYFLLPICRFLVRFLFAGWSLAEEMQLLRAFVTVFASYCVWYLLTTLFFHWSYCTVTSILE